MAFGAWMGVGIKKKSNVWSNRFSMRFVAAAAGWLGLCGDNFYHLIFLKDNPQWSQRVTKFLWANARKGRGIKTI